jgi:transglutaminase-like putative cysteine protease
MLAWCLAGPALAAEKAAGAEPSGGPTFGPPQTARWRVGMIVTAAGGPIARMTGTASVPMDWPEQKVKIVAQDLSPGVTLSYKTYKNTARQMVAVFPAVAGGTEVRAVVTFELVRRSLGPPEHPERYLVPDVKKLPGPLKEYLGPSPYIESADPRIKALAGQVGVGQTTAWEKVGAICECVRRKIRYQQDAPLSGVVEALDTGTGDCNQLTSAFVAMCRASGIAARTVRIPHHCYPEFYLEDAAGQGYWFASEAASDQRFGSVESQAPILQKGDNFRLTGPDPRGRRPKSETYRFLPETLTGLPRPGGGQPQLKLVCEPVQE